MDVGLLLAIATIGGFLSGAIAGSRGLGFWTYFVIGFLLPIIGLLIALTATPTKLGQLTPASGPGWWPDPTGRFDGRYYDGRSWTRHVARKTPSGEPNQYEDPI